MCTLPGTVIDQGPKSAEQSPAGGDARRQPDRGSTPRGSTRVQVHPLQPIADVLCSDGLALGMLALASGDLDTGGRTPSIDELRRAGDAAIARQAQR